MWPLKVNPYDGVFVVFGQSTNQAQRQVAEAVRQLLATIVGPWLVHFQERRGAPDQASFADLTSWTVNADSGIKYFSGTASYENSFEVPAFWLVKGERVEIDLGGVNNLPEMLMNGQSVGILV